MDKRLQHEELVTLLRSFRGPQGATLKVRFHDPVTLGRCGSLPASFISLLKDTFFMTACQAEATANKLNRHAVIWVDKMYTHRHHASTACPHRNPG